MNKINFKDLKMPTFFLEDFGKQFKYLHVDYEGELGWCVYLVTDTFTEYFRNVKIDNWYEIGLYENEDIGDTKALRDLIGIPYSRFYEVVYD
tara:strand:- start:1307 stop:1582 length:276 start_codon:yes stop_codon:yes gene_type:complete